ncbi:MAG: hypothetical protein ABI595_04640 [Actinomycetota bacterium]
MKVELHRPEQPDAVIATVSWTDGRSVIDTEDNTVRATLQKVFRRTPVVIDDPSYRRMGTTGEVLIQPGDLEWFRAVVQARIPAETGLAARFVPGVTQGGFDPAAGYRTFEEQIERLTT